MQGFQLDGDAPQAYERYLVPELFAPCAEQLVELAAVKPGERVLDVACGTGVVARRAVAAVGPGGTVVGVDVNEGMLAQASTMIEAGAVAWRVADAAALPLSDGVVDVVCCQHGLQFFTDQPGALREAHRVLTAGGRIALAVWRSIDHHPAFAALADALERHAGDEAAAMMRAPFAGPGRDDLRRLLTNAGFRDPFVRIGVIAARFPSTWEFLRREVVSTPLAGPVGALEPSRRDALIAELDRTLAPYTDDDGVAFPLQTWLATARR